MITEIGVKSGTMKGHIAAALVGAALLSLLLFPTIAGALLSRCEVRIPERFAIVVGNMLPPCVGFSVARWEAAGARCTVGIYGGILRSVPRRRSPDGATIRQGAVVRWLWRCASRAIPTVAAAAKVTVFAAASLKESMDDVARQFEANTGNKVVVSYGASNALARQIDAGAPADLFISADLEWMDFLDQRRLLAPDSRFNLLRNTLVLVAPASSTATLKIAPNFALAAALGRTSSRWPIPTACPPANMARARSKRWASGPASKDMLRARKMCAPRWRWCPAAKRRSASSTRTDALADKGVRIVDTFPQASYPPIVYPAALLAASTSPSARPLLEFLRSAPARAIWEKYGFGLAQ